MKVLLALFCGFFVNLIKKSLTTRFGRCGLGIAVEDAKVRDEMDIYSGGQTDVVLGVLLFYRDE